MFIIYILGSLIGLLYSFKKMGGTPDKLRDYWLLSHVPAVYIHEASHFVGAILMFIPVKEVKIEICPENEDGSYKSYEGYVITLHPPNPTKFDVIRQMVVQMAPLISSIILASQSFEMSCLIALHWKAFSPSISDYNNFHSSIKQFRTL